LYFPKARFPDQRSTEVIARYIVGVLYQRRLFDPLVDGGGKRID
jgi:hypothetical protein